MKITDHITFTLKLVNKIGGQTHLHMMIFEPRILHPAIPIYQRRLECTWEQRTIKDSQAFTSKKDSQAEAKKGVALKRIEQTGQAC